jgi:hypothetical protein
MAKAYLGKISALVTANTSDFNSKLNASAKEVRSFASAMQSSLTQAERAASTSLRGIYTESQKVSRALQAVSSQRLSFKGFDTSTFASLGQAVEQFKKIQNASVQINEPLSAAARTIEKLSASVQLAFEPAMRSSQKSAEYLSAALARGGIVGEKSFERIRLKAEAAAAAADRLGEIGASVGSLMSGREARFTSPVLSSELQRAADAQARLRSINPEVAARSPVANTQFAVQRQQEAARRAQVADAALAAQQVLSTTDTSNSQQEREDRARAAARLANEEFRKANDLLINQVAILESIATEEQRVAAEARAAADAVAAQARATQALKDSVAASLSGVPQTAKQARAEFDSLVASVGKLSAAGRGAVSPLVNEIVDLVTAADGGAANLDKIIAKLQQLRGRIDDINSEPERLRQATGLLPPVLQQESQQLSQSGASSLSDLQSQQEATRNFIPSGTLEKSAKDLKEIERNFLAVRAAANFGAPLSDVFESAQIDSYKAKLRLLQDTLIASGVTSGEAAEKVAEYAAALERASKTKGGIAAAAAEIAKAEAAAVGAVGGASGISTRRLEDRLKRVGDIGRGAFGNIGLGVQQAVFAIDDFFSVTGGLDQRIRAAGNNISQLGFVLGGTPGLIAGVSAAITGQLIVAYIKWANSGKTTEIQANALTSALEKQRTVAEGLRSALESLGRGLAGDVFSNAGRDARQFAEEIAKLRRESAEARADAAAATDPRSLDVEARKSVVSESLKTETNSARAEFLRTSLGDLEAARIRVRKSIADTPAPTADQTRQLLQDTAARLRRSNELGAGSPFRDRSLLARQTLLEQDARRVNEGDTFGDILQRRNIVRGQLSSVGAIQPRGPFGASARIDVSGELEKLRSQLSLLDRSLSQLNDESFIRAAQSVNNASELIAKGQNEAAKAFDQGVPGARKLENDLDSLGARLRAARDQLVDAAKIEDPQERNAAQSSAQTEIKAVSDAINARDREVKAVDAARRSVELFASAFDRVRQEAESNFQSAQAAADQAVGDDFERLIPPQFKSRERARAEQDLESQRVLRDDVRRETALAEERARQDEGIRRREGRIAEIDSQLNGKDVLNQGQRNDLIAERERLRADNEAAVQRFVDKDPAVRRARDASNFEERRRQAQERGFEARKTPAQRAGEELARTINDIQRTFNGGAREFLDNAAPAQRRAVEEAQRQAAPAIFNLADEVQNAVLQGPSRAALQATDVSTVQGASELNRLLRGDDSARNQNLVELQKQSASLSELVAIAKANTGNLPGLFD